MLHSLIAVIDTNKGLKRIYQMNFVRYCAKNRSRRAPTIYLNDLVEL